MHQHGPDVRDSLSREDNLSDGKAVLREHLADGIDHRRQVSVFTREFPLFPDGCRSVLFCGLKLSLRGGYRRDSELDKMLFDRAVPLLNVNGLSKEDWADFVVGSSNALMSTDPGGITAQYVESTGTSFSAQTEFLTRDENSVREIALRMIRPQSGVGESAESKQIDRQQLDTQLANFARRCANAEAQCWKIAARWMGLDDSDISTPYTENYDVEAAGDAIVSALVSLNSQAIISKQTIRNTSAVKKMMPEGWNPKEEETRLQQELGSTRGASGTLRLPNILGGTGTQGMNI